MPFSALYSNLQTRHSVKDVMFIMSTDKDFVANRNSTCFGVTWMIPLMMAFYHEIFVI